MASEDLALTDQSFTLCIFPTFFTYFHCCSDELLAVAAAVKLVRPSRISISQEKKQQIPLEEEENSVNHWIFFSAVGNRGFL
jgi:hypothetical protein